MTSAQSVVPTPDDISWTVEPKPSLTSEKLAVLMEPTFVAIDTNMTPTRSSKRSSSSSNDFIYERDRFRARFHNLNDLDAGLCEVCDDISTKTTKLNIIFDDKEKEKEEEEEEEEDILVRPLDSNGLTELFSAYFNTELPPTSKMFPWLHGLHHDNFAQRLFFLYQQQAYRRSSAPSGPSSATASADIYAEPNVRFLMCVNPSPDATPALKNSVHPSEVLTPVDVSRAEAIARVDAIAAATGLTAALARKLAADCLSTGFLPMFLNLDPEAGVSLRNFHIQVAKVALCSDFVVYSCDTAKAASLARLLRVAQTLHRQRPDHTVYLVEDPSALPTECTVPLPLAPAQTSSLDANKKTQLSLVNDALHSNTLSVWDNDYQFKEKIETTKMSSATKIHGNVWCGNIWDHQISMYYEKDRPKTTETHHTNLYCDPKHSIIGQKTMPDSSNVLTLLPPPKAEWKLVIHCHKDASFPKASVLDHLIRNINDNDTVLHLEFPPSGSIGLGDCKKENLMAIVNTCKLLYIHSQNSLVYCSDGYTELSLLVLCYVMYAENVTLDDAMLKLHLDYGRPFYIFNSDVTILRKLQVILNKLSPKKVEQTRQWCQTVENLTNYEINDLLLTPTYGRYPALLKLGYINNDSDSESSDESEEDEDSLPIYLSGDWVKAVEGSMPSRILPYLYLGSLRHANSLPLLEKLGIKKVISVGENLDWLNGTKFQTHNDIIIDEFDNGNIEVYSIIPTGKKVSKSGEVYGRSPVETVVKVNNLQDDGIDELTNSLPTILKYIDDEYKKLNGDTKILVHCRVGVSRSATVCIAEVMKRLDLTLPKAYLYVRVRRLNIVIQPNLRFMYELFKWEEQEKRTRKDQPSKDVTLRDIDWFVLCREITRLNVPYLNN